MKILHVAAEVFPLVKTGGLADVVAALPVALAAQGADARLLLPGLPAIVDAVAVQVDIAVAVVANAVPVTVTTAADTAAVAFPPSHERSGDGSSARIA